MRWPSPTLSHAPSFNVLEEPKHFKLAQEMKKKTENERGKKWSFVVGLGAGKKGFLAECSA